MKTNLSYLKEMSAGNHELVLEMIDIFCVQVAEFKIQMQDLYNNKEWIQLGKLAHKAKASVSMMGLDDLAGDLKKLELDSKEGKNVENYHLTLERFNRETDEVVNELSEVTKDVNKYF